jgi:hypothetical protein
MERLASLLAHRQSIACFAILGMLLNVLGLNAPLFTDDFLQWAIFHDAIAHQPHPGALFGLFDLVNGSPETLQAMKDSGRLPWSASDSLRLAFWRPVTELTHYFDYLAWPKSATMMRLHSLLWYGALIFLLGKLYRMLDKSAVRSGLATALFALSSLHFFVIMWISARNQLIAACFGILSIMAHHQWRTGRGVLYAWLAALTLTTALLSAEAGIAAVGYLAAYALAYENDKPWLVRLRALLPYLLIVVIWRVAHTHLGFGSHASGSYIDPGLNARFLHALVHRLPALMVAELTGVSGGITQTMTDAQSLRYAISGAAGLGLLAWLMHHLGLWSSRLVRFYALGALFALVPVCAISPNDRVLLNSEIGMSAVLAALFSHVLVHRQQYRGLWATAGKTAVALLFLIHVVLFPVTKLVMPVLTEKTVSRNGIEEALALPDDAAVPGKHVILINPPAPFGVFYYPLVRSYFGKENPSTLLSLANGPNQDIQLTVIDAHTLLLESKVGFVQPIVRDVITQPFKVGDVIKMNGIDVTVTKISDNGSPLSARFRFPIPLTDERWEFFVWDEPRYARMTVPAVGHSVHLAPLDLAKVVTKRLRVALKDDLIQR